VEMCMSGNPVKAGDALQCGILDRLIEADLLAAAVAFAREVSAKPVRKTRERSEKLGNFAENTTLFSAVREIAEKKRGLFAPVAAIEAVEAATKMSFEEGCKLEQKLFMDCLFSQQSKALIHVFLSEREVSKIPNIPKDTPVLPIRSVGVIGAGTMGGGIAMVLANAGIPVFLKEADQPALDRGLASIQLNYANSVKRGRFSHQVAEDRLKRITPTLITEDLSHVDLVIEAAFEAMALKKEIFKELDRVCKPGTILASNTSTLNIDEIASATTRPEYVIGTHFFSPANVMRLLEIVRGEATSKEVIATCLQFSKTIGKIGVLVGNCRGFVGNRMFGLYRREAQFLIEEGAGVAEVDQSLTDFGMAMGPLATGDLAGLDVGWRIRKEYRHLEPPGMRQPFVEDRLCELGRYGQKTGAGWYRYDEQRRSAPDPAVEELIRKWATEANIPQRKISSEEIADRCLYALINEGARIVEEGYALRASDIDVIYLNGYGFPAHRGGPMWYADTRGIKQVHERVCGFQRQHGESWNPAPLLKQLADQDGTFADLDQQKESAK
jgi:3-hydroxyacyl-CoA dehydrogenase